MGYLPDRKTRTIFVTGSTVSKNGRPRTIIVESKPEYAIVQLDGDKDRFSIPWEMIYDMAMKHHAACLAAEQKAHRKRKA